MFIQTETTPNPATLKFLPGQQIMPSGTAEFKNREEAEASSLAKRIFEIQGVESLFFGRDFLSVTKSDEVEWNDIKARIMASLMQHLMIGEPLFHEGAKRNEDDGLLDEISKQIKELIDTRVRPAVAQDGGDIIFEKFDRGIVYLRMRGACSGCPSSTITLKNGVENMLRHYVPEVLEVRQSMD
jgi:Fe-S cluster biogenesis protein NfuA